MPILLAMGCGAGAAQTGRAPATMVPPAAAPPSSLSDGSFSVLAFGAKCDGHSGDDRAFALAVDAANAHGGTVIVPAGATCVLTDTFNLGYVCPTGTRSNATMRCPHPTAGMGITIRGSSMLSLGDVARSRLVDATAFPSTVLFNASPPDCELGKGGGFATGADGSATARNITFEDLALVAGPNFRSCLVNETSASSGDPAEITVRRVRFLGNPSMTTTTGVYLANASWSVIDSSYFSDLTYAISSCASHTTPCNNYVNNLSILNSLFYSDSKYVSNNDWLSVDCNFTVHLNSVSYVRDLYMAGNAFEQGPNAIFARGIQGGDITSNWFEGEVPTSPKRIAAAHCPGNPDPSWIRVDSGQGLAISGNYFERGYISIWTQAYGETITANSFQNTYGTNIRLQAGTGVVEGNDFQGAGAEGQIDIDVAAGSHRIGPNDHATGSVPVFVNLAPHTSGLLFASAATIGKVRDKSAGGWTEIIDGALTLPGALHLARSVAPPAPPDGEYLLYVDAADGKLKTKSWTGKVTVVGAP